MKSKVHPTYKTKYRVANWPAYNQALVRRGDVTVWVSSEAIAAWTPRRSGRRGGQRRYSDLAIETALTLRLLYHLPLRQAEGFLHALFGMMRLDLSAPDYTTLSRRSQHLRRRLRPIPTDEGIHLVLDSTGLSIVGEGEWAAAKHGGCGRRGWRKLHLGVDQSGVIRVHTLTEATGEDATTALDLLTAVKGPLVRVTADAASDTVAVYETARARGAMVVIPPAKTANVSGHGPRSPARDRTITLVKTLGRRQWKKASGYHRQGRVENAFFRYKSIIGDGLRARSRRCCMNTLWVWGRASWAGCGPDVRRGGQTLIMGYSADKSPLIGHLAGPIRRLEPLGAQRQEKCGPNRPTPTGYSCNNAAHRGLEDRRVKLGCVMPGESSAVFGDALRRLAAAATYLYQDGPRFWYATQPTVTKLAEDRAEQLKRDPDTVAQELDARVRADLRKTGDFSRLHPLPRTGADVPDDRDARLVVLPAEAAYSRAPGSMAETAAQTMLESRGHTPRLYRNTLVFLAADMARLQDLDEAVRRFLAWQSILAETVALDLGPHQVRQAETQRQTAESTVAARLPETFQWLLVPEQGTPQAPITWQPTRLSGGDALAVRASKKLRSDESLVTSLASTILRKYLDDVPLWRGDHVAVKQLVDDFARYLYLPRLAGTEVLMQAIRDGLALLTWQRETFAYAESYDEAAERYQGLRVGNVSLSAESAGLLVKPDLAWRQMETEAARPTTGGPTIEPTAGGESNTNPAARGGSVHPPTPTPPKRFHGTVTLDPTRVGRDSSRIAEEVLAHLVGLVGSTVTVTLEINAEIPAGAPDTVVRTVTENSRTLKFTSQGFETE